VESLGRGAWDGTSGAISPHAPARCVRPYGTRSYRIFDEGCAPFEEIVRNSRGGHRKNIFPAISCDGPRALLVQPIWCLFRAASPADADVWTVPAGIFDPVHCTDNVGQLATRSNDALPVCKRYCNTDKEDGADEKNLCTLSANIFVDDSNCREKMIGHPLDAEATADHAEVGSREVMLPEGQVSDEELLLLVRGVFSYGMVTLTILSFSG